MPRNYPVVVNAPWNIWPHSVTLRDIQELIRTLPRLLDNIPFTNRPESSVEKRFASSTASSMITAVGVSGRDCSSQIASRRTPDRPLASVPASNPSSGR